MKNKFYAGLCAWLVMIMLIILATETKKPFYSETLISCSIVVGTLALQQLSPKALDHGETK